MGKLVCIFLTTTFTLLQFESSLANVLPRGLKEDCDKLLIELREVIRGSVDSGTIKLQTHFDIMVELSRTLLDVGEKDILTQFEQISSQLEDIKSSATNANLDISSCLRDRVDEFNGLPEDANNHLITCVTGSGSEVARVVNRAISNLNLTLNRVGDLENRRNRCGTGEGSDVCLAAIIGQVPTEMQELSQSTIAIVNIAMIDVDFSMESMEACGAEHIAKLTIDGVRILREIQGCVDEL